LRRPAIIIAPHQDDEVLGCGGMIALKRRAGAEVTILFLTDGSRSHPAMEPTRLQNIREGEALEAAQALGVSRSNVLFLRFPDSRLKRHIEEATRALVPILTERRPQQIFVPHRHDVYNDHIAANRIGTAALGRSGIQAEMLEYPVWLWRHWPHVPAQLAPTRESLSFCIRSMQRLLFSWRDLRVRADIAEALDAKRMALAAHQSQTTRIADDWPVLEDLDNGEFLRRLLGPVEMFCLRSTPFKNAD
jgi:LmbE family N-acetylglucosaminyl deacetylase